MIRIILAVGLLLSTVLPSFAACPMGTRYQCIQQPNGKMACGCY